MSTRLAKPEDLAEIVDIYNQAIAAGQMTADTEAVTVAGRQAWFGQHTAEKYPVLVAEKAGVIVGYLSISTYRPGRMALRHTAEVSFYIDFDHHRQGIATRLLQHAITLCPSLQIRNLFAILMQTNTASIELLKKSGFELWGQLPRVADYDGVEVDQVYYGIRI